MNETERSREFSTLGVAENTEAVTVGKTTQSLHQVSFDVVSFPDDTLLEGDKLQHHRHTV